MLVMALLDTKKDPRRIIKLKITDNDGNDSYYTLNVDNIQYFKDIPGRRDVQEMTHSMNNVLDNPVDWSKVEVSFDHVKQFHGDFFPYLNKTSLDHSACGIFNHLDYDNYKTNCFIQALEESQLFSPDEILLIRGSMNNRLTRVEDIQQIADMFNVEITIRFGSDDNATSYAAFNL